LFYALTFYTQLYFGLYGYEKVTLSFISFLDGTKIHQKYELPNFFLKNI